MTAGTPGSTNSEKIACIVTRGTARDVPGDKYVLFIRCPSLTLFKSEGQRTAPGQVTESPCTLDIPMTAKRKDAAPPIGDHLLTLREAAEVLRLSTRTVREYILRGEIEGRIIGGRWRVRRAELDAFFANARRNWDFAGKYDHGD